MNNLPLGPDFHQARTLFFPTAGPDGVLVETRNGRRREKAMRFADAHAALDWCLANRAGFVCWAASDPKEN